MGAPKIKIYQLDRGYSENNDNDIMSIDNDELLPVVDKPITPEDFYLLTGVEEISNDTLIPINLIDGEQSDSLIPNGGEFQTPSSGNTNILIEPSGTSFKARLYDSNLNLLDEDAYTLTPSGVFFNSVPYPSGVTIKYWKTQNLPSQNFITVYDNIYDGSNWEFRANIIDEESILDRDSYEIIAPSGLIKFVDSVEAPTISYTRITDVSKKFIGEHENWINGHMYMSPDIFRGMKDYPGDDTVDAGGNPIVQGQIPQFVEHNQYQIDFRRGVVTFPEEINSNIEPIHASYAYIVGIRNITNQELTYIGIEDDRYVYKTISDKKNPESIDSMWVGRKTAHIPTNIYVDGDLKPQLKTVQPYDELVIKNS